MSELLKVLRDAYPVSLTTPAPSNQAYQDLAECPIVVLAPGTLECEDEERLASADRGKFHCLPVLFQSSNGGV